MFFSYAFAILIGDCGILFENSGISGLFLFGGVTTMSSPVKE